MKSRGAPPPPGAAPAVSREIVNIVKKKLNAPSSEPPANMRSISRPTKYEEDDDDEDDMNVGEIEEKIGKKDYKSSGPRRGSEIDNAGARPLAVERSSWDNDDRNDERQFQQPRRTPSRRMENENDYDEVDEGSYDEYESDNSGFGKNVVSNSYSRTEKDKGVRMPPYRENFPLMNSEAKTNGRDIDDGRPTSSAAKGVPHRSSKAATYNFQPLLKATYRELRSFVLSPCEPGITTKCYIERTRGGSNFFAPVYSLCADLEDGTGRELLVCRKVLQSMSSHYVFSLKTEDLYRKRDQRSRLFLGKLRSMSSSEYVLYDNGMVRRTADSDTDHQTNDNYNDDDDHDDDDKDGKGDSKDEVSLFRKELAVICFNSKKRPAPAGVRGSEICIPMKKRSMDNSTPTDRRADSKDASNVNIGQSLQAPFQTIRSQGKQNVLHAKKCYVMHERTSRYDPLSSCLVDFKGRANMASVKNFQLVHSSSADLDTKKSQEIDAEKDYILQVGKTTVECFNMDYRYPLSMLQAFAIAVARFDAKLSW